MPRPLWTAREIIELTYKRSIHALLQSTVNLYLFHKSDQAFAEEVAERRGGFSYRRHIEWNTRRRSNIKRNPPITKRIQAESAKIQKNVIKDKILYLNTKKITN